MSILNTFHTSCPITHQNICHCNFLESNETKENHLKNSKFVYQLYTFKNPEFEKEFGKATIEHKVSMSTKTLQPYLPVTKENKKKRKRDDLKVTVPSTSSTSSTPTSSNQPLQSPIFKNPFLPILSSPSTTIQMKVPISPMSMTTTPQKEIKSETPTKKLYFDNSALKKNRGRPRSKPPQCKICKEENDKDMLQCTSCYKIVHTYCHEPNLNHIPEEFRKKWKCEGCKLCELCNDDENEEKIIICDRCDRGYHYDCVGLKTIPKETWKCSECSTTEKK
eukprot:gene3925-7136_t